MTFENYYGEYYPLLKKTEADLLEMIGHYPADCKNENSEEDTQPIIYCKSRIKSPESMVEKLKRSGLPTDPDTAMVNMHDAVGVRVICSFIDNVYQVADWITRQDGYELVERKDYISYPKPNGYRSLHLILRVKGRKENQIQGEKACGDGSEAVTGDNGTAISRDNGAATESSRLIAAASGLLVEIQLRTIAIDFWAALEHQMKYKHSISNERMIREELKRCADEIASVDMSMQTIRDAIRRA